ncbi:MAG: stage II sporulation protein M [Actinobacteria bacterium]|nr:stage II sporulation protein M [Actinomycetota bacterium]
MDVDSFIAQYRADWRRLEAACADGPSGLASRSGREIDELVQVYLRTSSQLAEVRNRFHAPDLESYLSRVVATAHGAIYGARPRTVRGLLAAFGSRYRQALHRSLSQIGVATVVFLAATLAVALWTAWSPEARAGLVPGFAQGFVDRAGGDLREASGGLSGFIFLNNVRVALLAFALGITLTLGTILVLAYNGLVIGALAGAATAVGHGGRFWALVLPHGFLEIIAIAIAAGAGLRMGWSVIAPGDRPRREAVAEESRDAVMVVVGVVPAFAIAAGIEGLLTGVTGLPALEIAIGALVAAAYVLLLLGWDRIRGVRSP